MNCSLFLLTGHSYDRNGQCVLDYYGHSPEQGSVRVTIMGEQPCFFIERAASFETTLPYTRRSVDLATFRGSPVDALYTRSKQQSRSLAEYLKEEGVRTYESDVLPERRFLMERFIHSEIEVTGTPQVVHGIQTYTTPGISSTTLTPNFTVASLDIETSISKGCILSIGIHLWNHTDEEQHIFLQGIQDSSEERTFSPDERTLLLSFLSWWSQKDPDIVIGWNVVDFDLKFIERRCKQFSIPCTMGRTNSTLYIRSKYSRSDALMTGRVVLDGPTVLRTAFYSFERFTLEHVATEVLGEGKLLKGAHRAEDIERCFSEDLETFIAYNLLDCKLVSNIFQSLHILDHVLARSRLTGLPMHEVAYSTAAFDHVYLPRLHRKGFVASNRGDNAYRDASSGGFVLTPTPGIYQHVALLDFQSLYPSIIRTFFIDPLSRSQATLDSITTPSGHSFSKSQHILPELITGYLQDRKEAKAQGDVNLSQAIKILMNSFYGVMGSSSCRFYHPNLPTAITQTGQWLLKESVTMIEQQGLQVLYGDTDSLFISFPEQSPSEVVSAATQLAVSLNVAWRKRLEDEFALESHLSLEFEKLYTRFVLPIARQGVAGAKKRYAGMRYDGEQEYLEFVGLEQVRTDWTLLAREFQSELYRRVLFNEPFEEWIRELIESLYAGGLDEKLVYTKRIRKPLHTYTRNIPPHVRAARLLQRPGKKISYVITINGPIPVSLLQDPPDYTHYVKKQLAPIADSILPLIHKTFDPGGIKQLDLFDPDS